MEESPDTEFKTITVDMLDLALMGLGPYVLLTVKQEKDRNLTQTMRDGDLILSARCGGGAEGMPAALPILMLQELPVEDNPVLQELLEMRNEYARADDTVRREVIEMVARRLGFRFS